MPQGLMAGAATNRSQHVEPDFGNQARIRPVNYTTLQVQLGLPSKLMARAC